MQRNKSLATSLLQQSTSDLLQLAATVCQARFAVLRIDGRVAAVNTPGAPLDVEQSLGARAAEGEGPLVVLDDTRLEGVAEIRFYAAVRLGDTTDGVQRTLAVLDDHPRLLSEREKQLLARIAGQMTRSIQFDQLVQASQQRLRRLQTFVDRSAVAMYAIENDRFACVNAKFAEVLGYTEEEILALDSVTDIIVDEQRKLVQEMIRRREVGDGGDVRYVTRVRRRDGRVLEAEIHGSVADIDGRRIVIGAAVEVTAQSSANRRVEHPKPFR